MGLWRYRGRHLIRRRRNPKPALVGAAAAVWLTGPAARAAEHEVAPGETLLSIAARYGTSVAKLASLNDIDDPNVIIAGQRLRIPSRARAMATHVVRAGETLSAIADRYGTTVRALARRNHLADPNVIVVGDRLRVPQGAGASSDSSDHTADGSGASRTAVGRSLERQAKAHGVRPALAKAVAWQESGWQQDVVSPVGAVGVMQVMPGTAAFVNNALGGGSLNLRSFDDNVHLGVMYLRHMLDRMSSRRHALAAYYAGPAAVGSKLTSDQQAYVDNVQALITRFD